MILYLLLPSHDIRFFQEAATTRIVPRYHSFVKLSYSDTSCLVDEDVSVASLASLHVNDGLVGVLHEPLLDPRLDLVVGGELEHVLNLGGGANGTATELDATADQGEGVDRGKVATVGGTDLDEGTLDLEQREVAGKRHLLAGDSGYDEIECASVGLLPVLVVVGSNVCIGTKLDDFVLLGGLTGDTNDLVSAKCLCEKDTKVAETTNSNNTDLESKVSEWSQCWVCNRYILTVLPGAAP